MGKFLLAIVAGAIAYFFAYMNTNDFLFAPWNFTWAVCHHMKYNCYDTLTFWENFLIDNIDWELESRTYFKMNKGGRYEAPEMDAKDGFSFEKLKVLTNDFTTPAVVRGLFAGTEAVKQWTPEYFKENFGNDTLIVLENGGVIDAEKHASGAMTDAMKTYTSQSPKKCESGYANVQKAKEMTVEEAVNGMLSGKKYYLSNVDTIFRKHNDLLDMVQLTERMSPWAYPDYRPSAAQIFMGFGHKDKAQTTGTSLHCAWGTNAFCQIAGHKSWEFIPSRYAAFLQPQQSSKFPAAVGLKMPDFVPRFTTTLHPGDMMLNPSWMWHRIFNNEGFNLGIATRENHPLWQFRNAPGMTMLHEFGGDNQVSSDAIDWLLKNETESQKKRIKFFMSIPMLSFSLTYIKEFFGGLSPHPMMDAWSNTCDEHDPRCAASFYDRMVYSYDECIKGQNEGKVEVVQAEAAN